MNSNLQEDQLCQFFGELKRADEQNVPSFEPDSVAGFCKTQSLFAEVRYGRVAAALLVILGVVVLLSHERSEKRSMALKTISQSQSNVDPIVEPASLDTWQSPTAFLLHEPEEWDVSKSFDASSSVVPATQPQPRHST